MSRGWGSVEEAGHTGPRCQAAHHPDTFPLPVAAVISFMAFAGDGSLFPMRSPWKFVRLISWSPLSLSAVWMARTLVIPLVS